MLFCPITLHIKDLIQNGNIMPNKEIVIYGDILLIKYNPFYIPQKIPRHDLLDFTSSVSNANFINKHMTNVIFSHSPMIKMCHYEIIFDYLEWRCYLYSLLKIIKAQIFIYLTKQHLYIYSYIEPQKCYLNISNFLNTWVDCLNILQINELQKCTSVQKCIFSATTQDYKICICLKTLAPVYLESDLELLESQFDHFTRPVLANRCNLLTDVPKFINSMD